MRMRWAGAIGLVAVAGCGPKVDPAAPVGPVVGPRRPPVVTGSAPGREVVVGEMCPEAAAGRPAVAPLFVRGVGWQADPAEAAAPVERGAARQFSVLSWDGRRAGLFSVVGTGDAGGASVAIGSYAGASPCAKATRDGEAELDARCVAVQRSCGVALSEVQASGVPFGEDPDPPVLSVGGACVEDDTLAVDIDGDGVVERFAVAAFLDEERGPAEEVDAKSAAAPTCTPRFSLLELLPAVHPRGFQGLDLLAVVDADGDGRKELVMGYRYAGRRTVALYVAAASTGRLELVGEVER
jgi:hypothetical protein